MEMHRLRSQSPGGSETRSRATLPWPRARARCRSVSDWGRIAHDSKSIHQIRVAVDNIKASSDGKSSSPTSVFGSYLPSSIRPRVDSENLSMCYRCISIHLREVRIDAGKEGGEIRTFIGKNILTMPKEIDRPIFCTNELPS